MVDYRAVLLKHLTHHFGVFTISVQPLEPGEAICRYFGMVERASRFLTLGSPSAIAAETPSRDTGELFD